jgi:hypothetical protein
MKAVLKHLYHSPLNNERKHLGNFFSADSKTKSFSINFTGTKQEFEKFQCLLIEYSKQHANFLVPEYDVNIDTELFGAEYKEMMNSSLADRLTCSDQERFLFQTK